MTLAEKIFAFHDVESKGYVHPGETIRVSIDWVMASEASWSVSLAMNFYSSMGEMLTILEHGAYV